MRNFIFSLMMLLCCTGIMKGAAGEPDFAYPQTVITDAREHLQKSGGKGTDAALAMLEITVATMAIDNDSVYLLPAEIHALAEKQTSPAVKSILLLIEAQTCNAIYNNKRWKYDRTDTPDEPLPADMAQWNGRQFKKHINSLAEAAYETACAEPLPTSDLDELISADRVALMYYPTVRDFVAFKAIDLLRYDAPAEQAMAVNSLIEKEIALSRPGSYSHINWLCMQLQRSTMDSECRYRRTLELYEKYRAHEAACQLLTDWLSRFSCFDVTPEAVAMAKKSLTDFPEYWNNNSLRNMLASLLRPWIKVDAPPTAIPGKECMLDVRYGNISGKAGLTVYRGTDNGRSGTTPAKATMTRIESFTVKPDTEIPSRGQATFSFTPTDEVYYFVRTFIGDSLCRKSDARAILATSLTPIVINNCNKNAVIVAQADGGRPVKGVNVKVGSDGRNPVAPISVGKTDDEGALRFRLPQQLRKNNIGSRYLQLVNNGRTFDFGRLMHVNPAYDYSVSGHIHSAVILTDRALYRPGDSIRWAAIASVISPAERTSQAARGINVKISLRDANYELVADTVLRTDDFGRVSGSFATVRGVLTGSYSILAEYNNDNIGNASVEVSDFKLPQFMVKIDSTLRDFPRQGWITIKGNASTYSMMPVSGADVQVEVKAAGRYRWFMPEQTIGYGDAVTDAAGNFTVELPDSLLSLTTRRCFMADVRVVASSGESRGTTAQFTLGKPLVIVTDGKAVDCADSITLPASVYNTSGSVEKPLLSWSLTDGDKVVASGRAAAPYRIGSWTDVPSGDYRLSVCTADTSLADCASTEISLYNTRLGTMSASRPLFVPEPSLRFAHGHSGELLYGVPDDTYLYMTLGVDTLLVSVEGIESTAGFHRLKLTLPEGYENGRLVLYAVKDGKVYSSDINIEEKVDRNIAIEGESFRDRIAPGDIEHWSLRLATPESARHRPSAMIATAYNKALAAIAPLEWPGGFRLPSSWTRMTDISYSGMSWLSGSYSMLGKIGKGLPETAFSTPELRYPISYYSGRLMLRGANRVTSSAGGVMVQEEKMYMASAADMAAPKAEASNNAMTEETADEEAEAALSPDSGSDSAIGEASFQFRPSEVLQALWMPSLVSDADGNVNIEFTVPEANTTWSFQAFAWDERLNSGAFERDVVSQKPVMVQPNLPRFLRAGDSATILATVYNNGENADSISTLVEVFEPGSGTILSSARVAVAVPKGESAIVQLPVEAPADASIIGYRVRSTMGRFTDGEQALIPILPATTEVLESEIFSMTANTAEAGVKLPKGSDMQLAFEFCSNPAWDVIKALPSLYEGKADNSWAAARKLFRAAAGHGLLHADPQIAPVLRKALDNPQDSSLVSQLAKNDDLKLATLRQTPWVQAAESQTARMARLGLLFDNNLVNSDINEAVKTLAKLQNSDGGFSWTDWLGGESSEWATYNVLLTIGRLEAMGFLPADKRLGSMIQPALNYLESRLGDRKTDINLTWLHTLLPDYAPGLKGRRVIDATVQELVGGWRGMSVGGKARAALMLKHYGYGNVAGEILNSIAEFAQTRKDGTIFFPSVDDIDQYASVLFAWASLEPDAQLIDGVRQWLVMRSQRTATLASCDPTALIAAFVKSGSRWTVPAVLPEVRLGDRKLDIPASEGMTGHFTMTVDNSYGARELTVSRTSPQTPAWGALFSRYTGRTDEIKAADCSQISIDKTISVLRDGKWQYAKEIKLGERVRVVLTLNVADDLQFVTVTDDRAAGLEPVAQLPGYVASGGVRFYRENNDSATRLFIGLLPRGTYSISYELTANMAGSFISGVASVQSQYAPSVTAHSSGYRLDIAH